MAEIVKIRLVEPKEHALLSAIAIRSKAHWGYSSEFMQSVRAELCVSEDDINRDHIAYWLAEASEGIAGFSAVAAVSTEECRLDSLFIEPHFIGNGVGKRLVEHAKSYAQAFGAQRLTCQSDPYAAPFYVAVGAVQVGESESDSIVGRYLPEMCFYL